MVQVPEKGESLNVNNVNMCKINCNKTELVVNTVSGCTEDGSSIPVDEAVVNNTLGTCSMPVRAVPLDDRANKQVRATEGLNSATGRAMTIPVVVFGVSVNAIIDTAAEVTVMNEGILDSITVPYTGEPAALRGAFDDSTVLGTRYFDVPVEIEEHTYSGEIIVAPLRDEMLLGKDFLQLHGALVNFDECTVTLRSSRSQMHVIPAISCAHKSFPATNVNVVTVAQPMKIPANSLHLIPCEVRSSTDQEYVIETVFQRQFLISPRVLVQATGSLTFYPWPIVTTTMSI